MPSMKKMVPGNIKASIFKAIQKILTFEEAFETLKTSGFLEKLPNNAPEAFDPMLDFLNIVTRHSTDYVTFGFLKIMPHLLRANPEKALVIEELLLSNYETVPEREEIIDQILKNAESISQTDGCPQLITLLFNLCQEDDFYDAHGEFCIKLFQKTIVELKNIEAVKLSYESLISFSPENPPIPYDAVIEQLNHEMVCQSALSALIRMPKIPLIKDNYATLLSMAQTYEEASEFLIKKASEFTAATAIINDSSWVLEDLPTFEHTVRLFVSIFKHSQIRTRIVTMKEIPMFLCKVLSDDDNSISKAVGPLFTQLPFTRAYLEAFQSCGFFEELFKKMIDTTDDNARIIYLRVISRFSELGYISDYIKNPNAFIECMQASTPVAKACFSTMNSMTMHVQVTKAFKEAGIHKLAETNLKGKVDPRPLATFVTKISNASTQ